MNENIFANIINSIEKQNSKNYSIYGFGGTGRLHYKNIHKDINIINIYDKKYVGEVVDDITIKDFNGKEDDSIILIAATTESYYIDIHNTLTKLGLIEYQDFFNIREYIPLYYYIKQNKLIIPLVHMALTTKCTLNCKNCNMFIPTHKTNHTNLDEDFNDIIKTIDDIFKNVDIVFKFVLLGGEIFLYKKLMDVIEYIITNYNDRIYNLEIFTNGSIIPENILLEKIKKYNISIQISDYTKFNNYSDKINIFETKLKEYNINYVRIKEMQWFDFLFPNSKFKIDKRDIKKHMIQCNPAFKGLNDSKLYYCHIVWSAVKAGLIKENKNDFFDLSKKLNNDEKLELLKFLNGLPDDNYISLCALCAGCGRDNNLLIDAGIQA